MRTILMAALAASICPAQDRLEILSATYGAGVNVVDLTDRVKSLVRDNALAITIDTATLGQDPAPGQEKFIHIRYRSAGRDQIAAARDFDAVRIPRKAGFSVADLAVDRGAQPQATSQGLEILSATYGWENRVNDVRYRLQALVSNNRLSFKVANDLLGGDPAVGKNKTLTVVYSWQGRTYQVTQREDRNVDIPDPGAREVSAPAPAAPAPNQAASNAPPPTSFDNGRPPAVRIFSARYIRGSEALDVRPRVEPLLANDRLSMQVNPGNLGVGGGGYLAVRYEFRGRTFERTASDGQTLSLP
jgi:hypothetical protein